MSKHTPGPWFVSSSGATVYSLHGQPQRNRFSATVQAGRQDDAPASELEANARLIAAAPELLEALQVFAERSSSEELITITVRTAHVERARAAIAKATGAA